jgi:site-specific DNA-methyltransferase (adenine-specific)
MNRHTKSSFNRTLKISPAEIDKYSSNLIAISKKEPLSKIINKTICQNIFDVIDKLPNNFVDLLIVDPPYNLNKTFNSLKVKVISIDEYSDWINNFISRIIHTLKKNASVYFCSDWRTSISIGHILEKFFYVRNRITWEREKGRGAKSNWKNNSEDIWFCTVSKKYSFNYAAVKLNRKVIAPYKDLDGNPKDWSKSRNGNYRLTFPSNIWTDVSVPFWSMPENTDHPTQKPEKLVAKLILASSKKGDVVLDPFLGSGTTSVVAKKLYRNYLGIELDKKYACLAEKRLEKADFDKKIQGYEHGFFWERNTIPFKVE